MILRKILCKISRKMRGIRSCKFREQLMDGPGFLPSRVPRFPDMLLVPGRRSKQLGHELRARHRANRVAVPDVVPTVSHGCSGPFDAQRQHPGVSLDHLVSATQQGGWHIEPKRLGGLEVDHQFELGGLLDRDVGGFRALHDLIDVSRRAGIGPSYLLHKWQSRRRRQIP
jgi:hypothetical protein